ncbi:Coenzyme F420 hydrogenase/dehydrogenase, beta subunit C-terminal domain [Parabacteroides sp.]
MIKIKELADCCGCTACASICAHDAIEMRPDAMGFLYPVVDTDKCIDCGLCEKVCSFNENYDTSLNLLRPDAYAARHKNMEEVESSRSGAAFIAISDWILERGGAVYGVGYTDFFRVVHKRAVTRAERDEFKGSKYVQSDLGSIFRQVKWDLKSGQTVLFSGTPCQTSGLNAFVGERLREKLYLVDIVCHGVSGPYLWRDYLTYLEKKQGDKICKVNFRDKQRFGWGAHHETFEFVKSGSITFNYLFYQHEMFRHSCGKCHFCNIVRPSDITIADFWGWEKTDVNINKDDKGVSLVLVNTEKGRGIFEQVRRAMYVIPAKLEDCLQPNLQHPTRLHPKRMEFEREFQTRGFVYVMKRYGNFGWKSTVQAFGKRIKNKLRRMIRR